MEERHDMRCKRASKDVKGVPDESPSDSPASKAAVGEIAQWVVFSLDAGRYALPLIAVERIIRAAHITTLPLAPDIVLGAIDVGGRVLPVFNTRRRFRLPERTIDPADHLLIARTAQRTVVLVIDAAHGVFERPATAVIDAASIAPDLEHIHGVIQLDDGLVLIHDLEHFLSPVEARTLDEAMNQQVAHAS
jgi:purine-binding chemotaxis protein CheW